jgi:hypothetical protein
MDTYKPNKDMRKRHPFLAKRWCTLTRITNHLCNEIKEMKHINLNCDGEQEMMDTMIKWKNIIYLKMKELDRGIFK